MQSQPTDQLGYYQTLAELDTTRTPSVKRFTDYGEYSAVIGLTGDTLRRLIPQP